MVNNQNELNYWEDYYIVQYNTMFPNGYNKRWNTNHKDRCSIEKEKSSQEIKEEQEKPLNYKTGLQTILFLAKGLPFLINICFHNMYLDEMEAVIDTNEEEWDSNYENLIKLVNYLNTLNLQGDWLNIIQYLVEVCQWWHNSIGYHQLKEIPDISFSKSRYTQLQKERLKGIQNVVKGYNSLKLINKNDTTDWFFEEISDKTILRWRVFRGFLEISSIGASKKSKFDYGTLDFGTLIKKLKENHEENIINQFYVKTDDWDDKLILTPITELPGEEIKQEFQGYAGSYLYIK